MSGPCETVRSELVDDSDLWSGVSSVHVAMQLLLTPGPYSGKDLVHYTSMEGKTKNTPGIGQL